MRFRGQFGFPHISTRVPPGNLGWFILPVVVGLGAFIVGFSSNTILVGSDGVSTFLTTIGIIQASILAIVFSVTLLGVQLVANRYTLRAADLFVRNRGFISTFAIFTLSISLDLGLLLFIDLTTEPLFTGFFYLSISLAGMGFVGLFISIISILKHSNPEGIASTLADQVDVSGSNAHSSRIQDHPTNDIYSFTISTIANDERGASLAVYEKYVTCINNVIENSTSELVITSSRIDGQSIHEGIFEDQLKEMLIISENSNRFKLRREVLGTFSRFGEDLLNTEAPQSFHVFIGLIQALSDTTIDQRTMDFSTGIVKHCAFYCWASINNDRHYMATITLQRTSYSIQTELESPNMSEKRASAIFTTYIQELPRIFEKMHVKWAHNLDTSNFYRTDQGFSSGNNATIAFHSYLSHLIEMSLFPEELPKLLANEKEVTLNCWKEIGKRASLLPVGTFVIDLYQSFIELSLYYLHSTDDEIGQWSETIAHLRTEGANEYVDSAFASIKNSIRQTSSEGYQTLGETTIPLPTIEKEITETRSDVINQIEELELTSQSRHAEQIWEDQGVSAIRDSLASNLDDVDLDLHKSEPFVNVSEDAIIARGKKGPVYIKFIQDLNPEDKESIQEIRNKMANSGEIANTDNNREFIVMCPNIDGATKDEFDDSGIRLREYHPVGLDKAPQKKLSDFTTDSIHVYKSMLS